MTYEFYKQIGAWVAGYATVAFLMAAVVAWLAHDMTRRVAGIHELRRESILRSSSSEQGALLAVQVGQASQVLPFVQSLLPSTDRLIDFPKESGLLARRQGLEFGFLFGRSAPGSDAEPGTLAFSISGKGSQEPWLQFMREFEAGTYLISVDDLRMASVDGAHYEITINGKIFTE